MKKGGVIYLGSDHAGLKLKEKIMSYLKKKNINLEDLGAYIFNQKDDYPDYILSVAKKVSDDKSSLGIILGKSGQGEAIAANKVKGIRAALIYSFNRKIITLSKEHNDSNILSLGAGFLTDREAIEAVKLWLETKFSNSERHKRRLKKIENFENRRI